MPGMAYSLDFAAEVQLFGQRIGELGNKTLHYPHEVRQVRLAAEWFLVNAVEQRADAGKYLAKFG
jgi:hypothetical protein